MAKILETPNFKTEAEEANWWDSPEGRAAMLQAFQEAAAAGTLGRGTLRKRSGPTPTTTIRLDADDIALAKAQADQRGLKYQTYLKMVIHQALQQESKSAGQKT